MKIMVLSPEVNGKRTKVAPIRWNKAIHDIVKGNYGLAKAFEEKGLLPMLPNPTHYTKFYLRIPQPKLYKLNKHGRRILRRKKIAPEPPSACPRDIEPGPSYSSSHSRSNRELPP